MNEHMTISDILKFDLLAVTVYLFSVFISTQIVKKLLKKTKSLKKINPVYISWIIGTIVFLPIYIFNKDYLNFIIVVQFIFLTLVLNTTVKLAMIIKKFIKKLIKNSIDKSIDSKLNR